MKSHLLPHISGTNLCTLLVLVLISLGEIPKVALLATFGSPSYSENSEYEGQSTELLFYTLLPQLFIIVRYIFSLSEGDRRKLVCLRSEPLCVTLAYFYDNVLYFLSHVIKVQSLSEMRSTSDKQEKGISGE